MKNKIIKNEEGSALVLAMMVLLVLSVLGAAVGMLTVGSYQLADNNQDYNSAYYIAEAGANMAYAEIEDEVITAYDESTIARDFFSKIERPFGKNNDQSTVEYRDFESQSNSNPVATVTIEEETTSTDPDVKEYTIRSVGKVAGKERTVEKPIKVNWVRKSTGGIPIPPINTVIIFKDELVFGNNTTVKGNILNIGSGEMKTGNNFTYIPVQEDGLITDINADWSEFSEGVDSLFQEPQYTKTEKFNRLHVNIADNTYIPNITLSNNDVLTINTNGGNYYLIVDEISIGNNNAFKIIGDGTLNIFVKNKLKLDGNNLEMNFNGKTKQLNMFYTGNNPITFGNNVNINGSLFIQNANLNIGNNLDISGYILSGGDTIRFGNNNNTFPLIFAPNAEIDFGNNENFNGVMLAKTIKFGNNIDVEYEEISFTEYPFNIDNNSGETSLENLISSEPTIEQ